MNTSAAPDSLQDIREALEREERTQAWLARKTQATKTAVNNYFTGYRRAPEAWVERARALLGLPARAGEAQHARGPPAA